MPHISIKAEKIGDFFGFSITNSLLASYLLLAFFIIFVIIYQQQLQKKNSRLVFLTHFLLEKLYSPFYSVVKKEGEKFIPLLMSFFLFILFSNWLSLLPGVGSILVYRDKESFPLFRGATADLNTTLALAIISVFSIQYYGIKYLGLGTYLKKFINLTNPIAFFTGILEILSEFSKILSFAFRLFGNIFAGEVLLIIVAFLIPIFAIFASFPFLILEIFVGFIQALVFSMLTAVFLSYTTIKEH